MEERSSDGIPSISVTFPDGYTDNIVLSRFYANEEDRMAKAEHCHYIGHLKNEPEVVQNSWVLIHSGMSFL